MPHDQSLVMIILTKFAADMTIRCRVTALLGLTRYVLTCYVTLTFDLEQRSYVTGHVVNRSITFEDPMPIHS